MVKKRGLGKSLDALLAYTGLEPAGENQAENESQEALTQLPVEQIQRGKYQPRRDMNPDALQEFRHISPFSVSPLRVNRTTCSAARCGVTTVDGSGAGPERRSLNEDHNLRVRRPP